MLREPAGRERDGGSSAESFIQAWTGDGSGGNTSGTVCGAAAGALSAYRDVTPSAACSLSVGACLYRLFLYKITHI